MKISGFATYVMDGKKRTVEGSTNLKCTSIDKIKAEGEVKFDALNVKQIKVEGALMGELISAETLILDGEFAVNKADIKICNCTGVVKSKYFSGEDLVLDGCINVEDIKSDNIKWSITADSVIKTINAKNVKIEKIDVESKKHFLSFFNRRKPFFIRVDYIEAESVELKGVNVERIRCNKAVLCDGCKVHILQVKEPPVIMGDASVDEIVVK